MSSQPASARLQSVQRRLHQWLLEEACPLWSTRGVDCVLGGFHEMLNGEEPVSAPRRVRVQPRQIAAFATAARLGWAGDAAELVTHGLSYLLARYRRSDGLFRTLIAPDGAVIDDRALLYDQAFVLLGLAESHRALGSQPGQMQGVSPAEEARALRGLIHCHFKREGPGFESAVQLAMPLSANAHMHLLEASLAWRDLDEDVEWQALADGLGELALSRFIDAGSGALREHFAPTWIPLPGVEGRLLEPGHHVEWAWLLLRWAGESRGDARQAAFRLIDIAERHGVRDGFAVNALLDDFSVHDACARLWPQTERIKAAALAARMTGESRYWTMAHEAAEALWRYLQTPVRGSWYDRWMPYGRFIAEPAPASSFYHIVGAIAELSAALETR
jgi:mannose/cellobiose epimerase-like protein (N-acyl-D-glucosamine 2-epimerase family)